MTEPREATPSDLGFLLLRSKLNEFEAAVRKAERADIATAASIIFLSLDANSELGTMHLEKTQQERDAYERGFKCATRRTTDIINGLR